MSIFTKSTPDATPDALNQRIIEARAAYDAEREAVVTLATERKTGISEVITDLQAESAALDLVLKNAQ